MGEKGKQESLEDKKIIILESVPEFLEKIIEINKNNKEKEIFYRGSSSDKYKIIPSVFRGYVEKEHIMFREMLLQNTENFYNDKTTLDKLVRMQHFGLPTRLLDITSNPLTALFFACEEEKEKNAEVIVFGIDECNINYPDSDTVASVSNLARMSYEERERIKETAEKYKILACLLSLNIYDKETLIQKIKELIEEENTEKQITGTMENLIKITLKIEEEIQNQNKAIQTQEKILEDQEKHIKNEIIKNREKYKKNEKKYIKIKEIVITEKMELAEKKQDTIKIKKSLVKEVEGLIRQKLKNIVIEKKEKKIYVLGKKLAKELIDELIDELTKELERKLVEEFKVIINRLDKDDFKREDYQSKSLIKQFNSDEDIQKLIQYVKDERGFFEDRILPKDLNRVLCVKSKKDNPRIRAQSGDFLLFGKDVDLNKDESNYDGVKVLTRIIIKPEYKKVIMEQLDKININRGTVYPDMPNTAEYIKNKYKETITEID